MKAWLQRNGQTVLLASVMVVFVVWGLYAHGFENQVFGSGPFGDTFGMVSAIAAGIAAILAAHSVSVQAEETRSLQDEHEELVEEAQAEIVVADLEYRLLRLEGWWSNQNAFRAVATGDAVLAGKRLGEESIRAAISFLESCSEKALELKNLTEVDRPPLPEDASDSTRPVVLAGHVPVSVVVGIVVVVIVAIGVPAHLASGVGTALFGDAFNAAVGLFTAVAVLFTLSSVRLQRVQLRQSQGHLQELQALSKVRQVYAWQRAIASGWNLAGQMVDTIVRVSINNRALLQASPEAKEAYVNAYKALVDAHGSLRQTLQEAVVITQAPEPGVNGDPAPSSTNAEEE